MKHAISILAFFGLACSVALGQKTDDVGRLGLNAVMFPQAFELPSSSERALKSKMKQACTKNGLGGQSVDGRFIITAEVNLLAKELTPTAPPMHALDVETTLYIGDGIEGTLFASVTITNKGVGNTEAKAYAMAFKGIKPTSDDIQSFIEEGKQKIVEYYNSQCDFILAEAQTLGKSQQYDDAIAKCMSIPEVCKDCYMKAMETAESIFMDKINLECEVQLNEARAPWSASQTPEGAEATSAILSTINPQSSCFKESKNFMNLIFTEIRERLEEIDRREWEMKVKQQEDATRLESERISAMKEIGKAYASSTKVVYRVIY